MKRRIFLFHTLALLTAMLALLALVFWLTLVGANSISDGLQYLLNRGEALLVRAFADGGAPARRAASAGEPGHRAGRLRCRPGTRSAHERWERRH